MSEDNWGEIKLRIGLLERDIQQSNQWFERLSRSIEKIQEVNANLLKMIALHEEKHEQHERKEIEFMEEQRDLENKVIHSNEECRDHIDRMNETLTEKVEMYCRAMDQVQSYKPYTKDTGRESFLEKLGTLDKFAWIVIGFIFFLGMIASHLGVPLTLLFGK